MTIAACYLTYEGVVLGADSTASYQTVNGGHYLNHNQKVFQLGTEGTLGIVTWGLGNLPNKSYRTLFAQLSSELEARPPVSVEDAALRWVDIFWAEYSMADWMPIFASLAAKPAYDARQQPPNPAARTQDEEETFLAAKLNLAVGFCIAGRAPNSYEPAACQMVFSPDKPRPTPASLDVPSQWFFGVPNIFCRLIKGHDQGLKNAVMNSGHWTGSDQQLSDLLDSFEFGHPLLPIREAVDFVHACIYSTIKVMKFSNMSQVCGGPIEIAVITTDRNFRWVRHKTWDTAIMEGDQR